MEEKSDPTDRKAAEQIARPPSPPPLCAFHLFFSIEARVLVRVPFSSRSSSG